MVNVTQKNNYVGIDVSKKTLDVYIMSINKYFKFSNDQCGFNLLVQMLQKQSPEIVVFEASGGYEIKLLLELQKNNIKVWRVEPRRVSAFKKSEGIYAKTDTSDAKVLALFGAEKKQKYKQQIIAQEDLALQSLARRRDDIKKHLTAEKTRLAQESDDFCKNLIMQAISFLEKQIAQIEDKLHKLIKENEEWNQKIQIMQSMKSVGPVTAITILTSLKELGRVSTKEIAALAGLAPYVKQSGSYNGRAFIQGGRADVRKILYMAALNASQYNPVLKTFYEKLIKAGKKAKVALIAVARKMLVILNAMMKKKEIWKVA